jgi:hypothetical protein
LFNFQDPSEEDLYDNIQLLEPLNSFSSKDSHIQLNYTQLFSFHISYSILGPTGQPQGGRWFNVGKKVRFPLIYIKS